MQHTLNKPEIDYIISILRQGTVTWRGRTECLNRGRRQVEVGETVKGKIKYLWQRDCDGKCGRKYYLKDNMLEVDHIIEIGPFQGDWNDFILRMYCHTDNLQALCKSCHAVKTAKFNAALRYQRKERKLNEALEAL